MGWRFRKTKRFGPFSVSLTHRGLTTSVGAGGLRYQISGPGRRRARGSAPAPVGARSQGAGATLAGVLLMLVAGAFVAGRFSGGSHSPGDEIKIPGDDSYILPSPDTSAAAVQHQTAPSSARGDVVLDVADELTPSAVQPVAPVKTAPAPIRVASLTPIRPQPPAKARIWTDNSGKHTTLARLTDMEGATIYLQKENGDVHPVPLTKLSLADQEFIRTEYPIRQLIGEVVGITDGDTLTLLDDNKTQHKLRLDGIDAPESHQDYGTQSRKLLAKKVIRQQVRAEWFDKDRYGRILADVYLGDRWINRELIVEGSAWHFKRYNNSAVLAAAEVEAKALKLGLWSQSSPIEPWNFRRSPAQQRGPPVVVASLTDDEHADHEHDEIVYITDSGTRYHREGCKYLTSSTPVPLSEVQGIYTPCKICHPELVTHRSKPEKSVRTKRQRPSYNRPRPSVSVGPSVAPPYALGGGGGGTVHVRGYYRKNGTYVQPHTRNAPRH